MDGRRVLLLLLLMTVTLSSAKILLQCTRHVEEVTVESGGSVMLPCSFNWTEPMPEMHRAVWQKNFTGAVPLVVYVWDSAGEHRGQVYDFVGRTFMAANWFEKRDPSLNLTDVSVNDTGIYGCHIVTQRPHSSGICADIRLMVFPGAADVTTVPSILLLTGLAFVPFFS